MLPQALWGNNTVSGCQSNLALKLPCWVALETVDHIALRQQTNLHSFTKRVDLGLDSKDLPFSCDTVAGFTSI